MPNHTPSSAALVFAVALIVAPSALRAGEPDARRPSRDRKAGSISRDAGSAELAILHGGTAELHRLAESTPDAVLDQIDLDVPRTCSALDSREALARRREVWELAIRILGRTHPEFVLGWLTGTRRPPSRVMAEVRTMRNCLLDALFREASRSDTNLTVELEVDGRAIRSPTRARAWALSYGKRSGRRELIRDAVTESHYRSALEQTEIWQRKIRFLGATFDRISAEAARQCKLDEGGGWNPGLRRHERCWRRELSASQRGREILSASAAPGLSRHHWGTEIDLFVLSSSAFRPGRERHDEYQWLSNRAFDWGFYQTYTSGSVYVPERWHWSYEPIAGALTAFANDHLESFEERLNDLWERIERRHNRTYPTDLSFDRVRDRWKPYVFGTSSPPRR